MRWAVMSGICALLLTVCCHAMGADGGIWGKTIMAQPLQKEEFREITPPKWVEDLSVNLYAVSIMKEYDLAQQLGAQITEMYFVDPQYVHYDSKLLKDHRPGESVNQVDKIVEEYRKRGIRIISAHGPWLQAELYKAHPDWRAIPTNTTTVPEVDLAKNPFGDRLCFFGPYGDYLIDILSEELRKYNVDAFNFDGIHHFGPCYCQYCRDAYRKDAGQEIPNADMNDPAFRRYLLWQDRRMEGFIERMQTRLKSIRPDVAIITYTTNAGRLGHLLEAPHGMSARMNLLFDGIDQEFWMDETNRGNSVVSAFANSMAWAVTNHRTAFSTPYLMTHANPYGTDSFPQHEYVRRAMLVLTQGPFPAMAISWANNHDSAVEAVREVNRRSKWLTHKESERWAALVMGDYTRQFYGRDPAKMEERYLSNVFGAFRVGIEEHLPVTVVNEWNLCPEDLAQYKVLVLANTAVISDEQAKAIREYVRNGGGLVATVDASLFDEFGNPRQDFALADVFGAHYAGVPSKEGGKSEKLDTNFVIGLDASYWEKRKSIFDFSMGKHDLLDLPRLKQYLGSAPVTFKGQAVTVSPDSDAQVIGTISVREEGSRPMPGVVVHQYVKGRVVYLAAGFDSAYYLYPYPYQRLVLAQAMRWAAGAAPRITVKAPMCVQSTFFRQNKDGERLVVQLFNEINTTANHARPDEDVPLTEEVVPVHDITVAFDSYRISRIHLEPEGIDLPMKRTGRTVEVTVPRLDVHSMVVAELKTK